MNKFAIIITASVLFPVMLYAENDQRAGNTVPSTTARKIIPPAFGSQYNLEGVQTDSGQYKSSYSTNSVDNRGAVDAPQPHDPLGDKQNNAYANPGSAVNPAGPGFIIVIDD